MRVSTCAGPGRMGISAKGAIVERRGDPLRASIMIGRTGRVVKIKRLMPGAQMPELGGERPLAERRGRVG